MSSRASSELGHEAGESSGPKHLLETLDDIPREIADRRLQREFGDQVPSDRLDALQLSPDQIEDNAAFASRASQAGINQTEGLLGWSTDLESPAHIRRGEVPREIATLVHEDLHRLTHPETLSEGTADPALRVLYEGVTEYLTQQAVEGLRGHKPLEAYPEQVAAASRLAGEVGEDAIKAWFFRHEMSDELQQAIARLQTDART